MEMMSRFNRTRCTLLTILCALFCVNITHATEPLNKLPAEAFYRMPLLTNVQLSPDGTHLIALRNVGEATAVMTLEIATGKVFYAAQSDNKKFKINWISWANNDRILLSVRYTEGQIGTSLKFGHSRLISMDAKKESKMINMVKPSEEAGFSSQYQDHFMGRDPNNPDNIIMGVDDVVWGHQTVYSVNVNTGKRKTLKKEDMSIREWYADTQGVVRAGEGYDDKEKKVTIKVLDPNTQKWTRAWEYTVFENPSINPLGFGKNPNELYLLADHNGRQALFKADLAKEGYPWELILSDETYDISGSLIYSPSIKDVVGLYYSDSEDRSIFWNNDFKRFQAGLDKAFAGKSAHITSLSDDARKYIIVTSSQVNPGTIMFGNRDTKQVEEIAKRYPDLTEDILVKKELMTYKARDGLELEGYLSRPKDQPAKPLATILFPHGGPMSEDTAGFDYFSSFFTNRGYAVFQPNFRGSSGRGHDFMMQAVGGMGLAMQDDLEDAVKFLVDKKIADPKKICIVGASYGGYAALMGAVKTPDLFQCAISFAGISDIKKLRDGSRYFMNKNAMREQLGNDTDQLKKTSPVRAADKIKIPILLIHGKDDSIVPVEQSRIMAEELKDQHKTYEYVELEGGSHFLDYLPHRKQTFESMEVFLSKYLPIQ
jgi:dipeptidyl aminopeptidase/acylaminoacyl peptidase